MKSLAIPLVIIFPICLLIGYGLERYSLSLAGTRPMSSYSMIDEGQSLLKEGDLLVRLNRDPSSGFIKYFNKKDKSYSHSGIVLFENGYPYVYHIVVGDENPGEKIKKDSLWQFCDPKRNSAFGIYRYELTTGEIKQLKDIVHGWYTAGISFDQSFNLATNDKMYCSEMVSKAVTAATHQRILFQPAPLTLAEAGLFSAYSRLPITYTTHLSIIPIDALYVNPFCHEVKKYSYQCISSTVIRPH